MPVQVIEYCQNQELTQPVHVHAAAGGPQAALFGIQLSPGGHEHIEVAPAELLSVNTIAGEAPPMGQGGGSKVRLFDSPVVPPPQEGAFVVPLSTLVVTTTVVPGLGVKLAVLPQHQPNTLNSAWFHWVPMLRRSPASGVPHGEPSAASSVADCWLDEFLPVRYSLARSVIA